MNKRLKIAFLLVAAVIVAGLIVRGWLVYQRNVVCEPRVRAATDAFFHAVRNNDYKTLPDRSMFVDQLQFESVKKKIQDTRAIYFKRWGRTFNAYVYVTFGTGTTYAVLLVPSRPARFGCWGVDYKVLTIE